MKQMKPALISAFIYLGISTVASGIFLAVTIVGDYSWVARAGGAAWIFFTCHHNTDANSYSSSAKTAGTKRLK